MHISKKPLVSHSFLRSKFPMASRSVARRLFSSPAPLLYRPVRPHTSFTAPIPSKLLSNIRTMASQAPRKFEWLVVVPDFPGVLAKRMEVRSKHFEGFVGYRDSGEWKMGGALLEEIPKDDEPSSLKMNGSTLVVTASTKEEIMEMLKADIYAREGVWDLEKVQMWPFKCAFRNP